MKIGLFGVSFCNANKGVCALAYASLFVINKAIAERENNEYLVFAGPEEKEEEVRAAMLRLNVEDANVKVVCLAPFKKAECRKRVKKAIKECDYIVDLTGGDSFSDIYGEYRFLYYTYFKRYAVKKKIPLILGPQTIGPFKHKINAVIAKGIIKKAHVTMARDDLSAKYTKEKLGVNVDSFIDVAFFLPYDKTVYSGISSNGRHAGINVSALLWNGGYTGKNQFGLALDYQSFVLNTIELLNSKGYTVHLIPHVIVEKDYNSIENDVKVCDIIHEKLPYTINAPIFTSPVDAKSYIANLNVFIGSRMHATIAGLSSGVKTIPVAYSRKFAGLFGMLNYNVGIDGTKLNTQEALDKIEYYLDGNEIEENLKQASVEIEKRKAVLIEKFTSVLNNK